MRGSFSFEITSGMIVPPKEFRHAEYVAEERQKEAASKKDE